MSHPLLKALAKAIFSDIIDDIVDDTTITFKRSKTEITVRAVHDSTGVTTNITAPRDVDINDVIEQALEKTIPRVLKKVIKVHVHDMH